ncbi:MAG: hypothetical protein RBU30_20115 [Polyangia bacterium]|jgi:hypothetical protein|nr:hypothetical protein [Polyangia bacterium]
MTTKEGYSGPERRRPLATMELWQENVKALNQGGLTNCQMRYALTEEQSTFIVRFENEVPAGHFDLVFPFLDPKALEAEGWKKLVLTISINDEGRMAVELWGRFEKEEVPLDVRILFERDVGLGVGITKDSIDATDARTAESVKTSFQEVISETMRDDERRYARKDDEVGTISVEGMVAVLGRFLRHQAVSRRLLPR